MRQSKAISAARNYLSQYGIGWLSVRKIVKAREWWYFTISAYTIEVDTGDGYASLVACRHYPDGIWRCEYYPTDPSAFWLPLWAAYPTFSSVTIGWRMAECEEYKYKWNAWYHNLSGATRAEYQRKFPPPEDEERAWKGFYEWIADVRFGGNISEVIIGRV